MQEQFGYAYDNIGNRQWATFGGDSRGGSLQTISYTVNDLDQYTSILTPGAKEIIGAALADNSVTVNGQVADRNAEYFHSEISVANTNQPVWQEVSVTSGGATDPGGSVFPANSQALTYDADGNLTFDGVWTYGWDGENRLIEMTMTNVSGIANSNRLQLQFVYDYMGRRAAKIVSAWNGSAFVPQSTNYFLYDGWNLIAVFNPQDSVVQSFVWGNDLSGTLTKAGGVGGLLMADISSTNCFPAYDGNGNITALISAADQSTAARYQYSPYGDLIRATGPLAHQNPFRFSTKFWDDESGLVYYNCRFYSPTLGKWISRDPTIDQIYLNLYLFCQNNPLIRFDRNGCDDQLEFDFAESISEDLDSESDVAVDEAWSALKIRISLGVVKGMTEKLYGDILKHSDRAEIARDMAEGAVEGGVQGAFSYYIKDLDLPTKLAANGLLQADFMYASEGKLNALQLGVGMAIGAHETDSEILDTILDLSGSMGVDDLETIWGVAEQTSDGSN